MILSGRTIWKCGLASGAITVLSAVSALAMDKVTLRTEVFFHGPHAPFFLGVEKGFYKDDGIELTVNAGTGSGTVIKLVGNRNDDFGYADGGTLVKAVSEGVPVKMVMGILQASPMAIVSLREVRHRHAPRPSRQDDGWNAGFLHRTHVSCLLQDQQN